MLNKKALVSILVVLLYSMLFANSSFIYDAQELKTMGKPYKLRCLRKQTEDGIWIKMDF